MFAAAFQEAYDVLFGAMSQAQVPRIELMINWELPPMTQEITPADMGITDFADYIFLRERPLGSNDKYTDITNVDVLTQRAPTSKLIEQNYRDNTFFFIGATGAIDLQLKYETSGTAPSDDNALIMVDNCGPFLYNYCVGVAGGRKGRDKTAAACMMLAVGPKYVEGTVGGQLFQLIQPLARSRQKVQVAPKPYTVTRRYGIYRQVPFVAAQQGTTGGGSQNVPVQYTSENGTIVGSIDGINVRFWIIVGVTSMQLYVNGVLQTVGTDYTYVGNQITFALASIPQPGDRLTADAFPIFSGQGNYGSVPTQVVYPVVPLFPPSGGGGGGGGGDTAPIQFNSLNGTITGTIDGNNPNFQLNQPLDPLLLFRNGGLQTVGVDYNFTGPNITFASGSIPQIGDLLTAEGF